MLLSEMNTSDPQLDQLIAYPWAHQGLLKPSSPPSPLSLQAPEVLPPVRDDTESEKRLAELEGPPSKGAECRGEARRWSAELEKAKKKLEQEMQQPSQQQQAHDSEPQDML
jgi:hypothetical protein